MAGYKRGYVLAGGEYGDKGSAYENAGAAGGMTYTNPGVYGDDYLYPNQADLTYIKSRNPGTVIGKLMVRMERLTTSIGGPLRTIERDRITAILDAAQAEGVEICLCPWNFGAVWTDNGSGTSVRHPIGDGTYTLASFYDFWTRVMTQWGDHPALTSVELDTEPVAITNTYTRWENATQGALDAIRAVTPGIFVWVPLYGWGIDELAGHAGPWINDPTGLYGYAGHQYNYNRGGSQTDYTNALQSAINQGYTAGTETDALHTREVQSAQAFATWLNGAKGFISEYGIPQQGATGVTTTDATKWAAYGERMLDEYDTQGWWATIWTSGRVTAPNLLYTIYYPSGGWDTNTNAATNVATITEAHPSTATVEPQPASGGLTIWRGGVEVSPTWTVWRAGTEVPITWGDTPPPATNQTITGLTPGTNYEVRVKTTTPTGDSPWTAWTPFTTTGGA